VPVIGLLEKVTGEVSTIGLPSTRCVMVFSPSRRSQRLRFFTPSGPRFTASVMIRTTQKGYPATGTSITAAQIRLLNRPKLFLEADIEISLDRERDVPG